MHYLKQLFKPAKFEIPILCYHAKNTSGRSYETSDHIALTSDIELLLQHGFAIKSLKWAVDMYLREGFRSLNRPIAIITFDDGPNMEYYDFESHETGKVKSFHNIMRSFEAPATSFVIASPTAREQIAGATSDYFRRHDDNWWLDAAKNNPYIDIANHSWDHNHESVSPVCQKDQSKGNFFVIDNYNDANDQIRKSYEYIHNKTEGNSVNIFGYPYGHTNQYLQNKYFPDFSIEHKMIAAVSTDGDYFTQDTNPWNIPRFVCGHHWKNSNELKSILKLC